MTDSCPCRHATRTRRPFVPSTSLEPPSRFCASTCSSPPRSSVTWYRVTGPTYCTSWTSPSSTCAASVGCSPAPRRRDLLRSHRVPPAVALEHVRHADEPRDELALGVLVDLRRRPDLLDSPLVEHGQAVGHRERLLLIVGDVDEGDPDLPLDGLELDLHLLPELQVERAERLVEQEHLRAVDDRSRERDALALAARELRRLALAVAAEPDHAERLRRPLAPLALSDLLHHEPVLDVRPHGHVREQRVVLEDRVHGPVVRREPRHVLAGEPDRAFVGRLEARDHAQRRRLAGARRPEHREELARGDVEVHRGDRDDVSVAFGQASDADVRGGAGVRRQATPPGSRGPRRARRPRS